MEQNQDLKESSGVDMDLEVDMTLFSFKICKIKCPKVKSENYNLNEPLDFDF